MDRNLHELFGRLYGGWGLLTEENEGYEEGRGGVGGLMSGEASVGALLVAYQIHRGSSSSS